MRRLSVCVTLFVACAVSIDLLIGLSAPTVKSAPISEARRATFAATTEVEPNNTAGSANTLPSFNPCSTASGAVEPADDVDFFSFSATAGQKVWAYVDRVSLDLIGPDGSTVIETDSFDGTVFDCASSPETTHAAIIAGRAILTTGIHFIRITGEGAYTLNVVLTNPSNEVPETEPNFPLPNVNPIIPPNQQVGVRAGFIDVPTGFDLYSFQAMAGDHILLAADCNPERDGTNTDVFIYLVDTDGSTFLAVASVGENQSGGVGAEGMCFTPVRSGTYFAMIAQAAGSVTGTYSAMVTNCTSAFPCVLTCPPNQIRAASTGCQSTGSTTVTFASPTLSANCAGSPIMCAPASGSAFPVGITTVTCTTTDASGATPTCSFTVTVLSRCLQDDGNPGNVVLFDVATGAYRFCCGGSTFTGVGSVTSKGCSVSIQHNIGDRRVLIKFDGSLNVGSATLQSPAGATRCVISDRNASNNNCVCP